MFKINNPNSIETLQERIKSAEWEISFQLTELDKAKVNQEFNPSSANDSYMTFCATKVAEAINLAQVLQARLDKANAIEVEARPIETAQTVLRLVA